MPPSTRRSWHPIPTQDAALDWVMQVTHGSITLSRSRYTEDCLEEAVRQGVPQYVILGAGLDTFAFRRPDLMARLQVFEIDHPVTQAMKRQRIARPGWTIPTTLHFVPVDFATQDLSAALAASPYDAQQASFFSWQGVTYYLTRETVLATLTTIAKNAPRGSQIVFDYIEADGFIPEKTATRMRMMQDIVRQTGEPMQTGFDPHTLAADLDNVGWHLGENLNPAAIESRFFQGRTDRLHAFEHVWFARASIA